MADILPQLHKNRDRLIPLIFPLGLATVFLMRFLGE